MRSYLLALICFECCCWLECGQALARVITSGATISLSSHTARCRAPQVEAHPYLPQERMLAFCAARGIVMQAYSPLGTPGSAGGWCPADMPLLLRDPVVTEIAAARGATPGQVLLAYQRARGVPVVAKSVNPARIRENFAAAGVALSARDVARLSLLARGHRFGLRGWGYDEINAAHPFAYDKDARLPPPPPRARAV
jgi:diketogulonate reductase-like aldo/keto reductase